MKVDAPSHLLSHRRFSTASVKTCLLTPMCFPERQGLGDKALAYPGGQTSEMKALSIWLRNDRIVVVDLNFDGRSRGGSEMAERLLSKFDKVGHRDAQMLGSNLEVTKVQFDEFEQKVGGTRALMSQRDGIIRVLFYDGTSVSSEEALPSVNTLPPGLLDRARKLLERQKQQHSGE